MTLEEIKQQFLIDKKKTGALLLLFGVLVVVLCKSFSSNTETVTPAAAVASTAPHGPSMVAAPAQSSVPRNSALEIVGQKPTPALLNIPASRKTISVAAMPRTMERDLFMTSEWARFPLVADASAKDNPSPGREAWNSFDNMLKQYRKTRREATEALSKDLSTLQLQSTMTGSSPLAFISGHLVREGDAISGFSVVRIEERKVFLERAGQTLELTMQ